jgi:hypothetical protein
MQIVHMQPLVYQVGNNKKGTEIYVAQVDLHLSTSFN